MASAQSGPRPVPEVRAVRTKTPITIDGRLNEEAWLHATPATGFLQKDPDEGKDATERTEVRIAYDDRAIYVGARMFDRTPATVGRRLSRRDADADADYFIVGFDPHHDHLTGFFFKVSAAGAQSDGTIDNDTATDNSWDGVWSSAVTVDDSGWTAELRIPYSQLRFPSASQQVWGVNAVRFIRRRNEESWFVLTPKKENGLASRMAHLVGLDDIPAASHLEWLPYTVGRAEYIAPSSPGDPFNDGSRFFGNAGLDVKWGLTSNLTLSGTVNPDFGQVEVDPAVVNLTAFETFYEEKRPFFLEGAPIFGGFGQGGTNSSFNFNGSPPSLFYSRRIGRAPQGSADGDFVDVPSASTILGAAKITGKVGHGWSLGLLDAVTSRETARESTSDVRSTRVVEPATNYLVGRAKRDLTRAGFGVLMTGVERGDAADTLSVPLARRAYVAGGDGYYFLDATRDWVVHGSASGSWVQGSTAAIDRLQRAPQRYYQRPDAPQVSLDPNATSLAGWSGRINLNRNSGDWGINAALWGTSPGFESNDVGFMSRADQAGAHGVFRWAKPTPDRWTRSRMLFLGKWWTWNYGGDKQSDGVYAMWQTTLLNYWTVGGSGGYFARGLDDRLTRGGPSVTTPRGAMGELRVASDSRKTLSLEWDANYQGGAESVRFMNASVSLVFKPSSTLSLSTGPSVMRNHDPVQYVQTVADPLAAATHGSRYVFADLHQTEVSMTTRLNLVLRPTVSLQVYAQPLISVGKYTDFKELAAPRTFNFLRYGAQAGTISRDAASGDLHVDPDGNGPAAPFAVSNPSFNFKSLRLNAIFRWEWRPGSTIYVVWTEQRQDSARPGWFQLGPDTRSLFSANPDDVFMVKVSYWLGR